MAINSKIIYTVAAVIALSGGYWLSSFQENANKLTTDSAKTKALIEAKKNYSPIQGTILDPARKISIPPMTKDDGSPFVLDDLMGDWHLLFFGYTHCPDVCPVTMGVAAKAKAMAQANNHIFPQVIFISVDPDRDKVEMLADYVQYFDKEFIGVTGDNASIKALTLQLSVVYMKMAAEEGSDDYIVDHSSALLLINPEGRLVAFFNPPHEPKTILKDFQTVVNLSH